MITRRWLLAVVVLFVACSPIAVFYWPAPRPAVAQLTTPDCTRPDIVGDVAVGTIPQPAPDVGARPPGFTVTSVITCTRALVAGTSVLRQSTASIADVPAIADAIDARSYRFSLRWTGYCPTIDMAPLPVIWLVNADGEGYRPSLPTDHCGDIAEDALKRVMTANYPSSVDLQIIPAG